VRFGRKKDAPPGVEEPAAPAQPELEAPDDVRAGGPYDSSEVDVDETADQSRVDLGSLVVTGRPGLELRLQVDEQSGAVAAVLLVAETGAVELRAFASPRNGSIWDDVRRTIAAEAARQGGTATEQDGPWGTELRLLVTGTDDQGRTVTQASRVVGITGPRWLLRATFFGGPAEQPDPDDPVESAVRDVVVVRGSEAMAPGEFLPMSLPPHARRMGQPG
jgi:hypothetical protein